MVSLKDNAKVNNNIDSSRLVLTFNIILTLANMNGELLKTQLLKIEPTLVEVANKLGISKQNLDSKLSATDIKTGFIEQLAALYSKPISFFYGEKNEIEINEVERSFNSNADEIIKELTSIIKAQEARIAQLTDILLGL